MKHTHLVVNRVLALFILLFSFLYIYVDKDDRRPASIENKNTCMRNLSAFTIKKKRWLRSYFKEVKSTKGLRVFIVNSKNDPVERRFYNLLERYERPEKSSYWDLPMDTLQFLPRKLSKYFSKDNTEYNFTPLYSIGTPIRKGVEYASMKTSGKMKEFTITTHLITGVFVFGYFEDELLEYLDKKKEQAALDKIRSEWPYLKEKLSSDLRFKKIQEDHLKELKSINILYETGLISKNDFESSIQKLKDKTSVLSMALVNEINTINKLVFEDTFDTEKRNEITSLLFDSSYNFEDIRVLSKKMKLTKSQKELFLDVRIRKIASESLLMTATTKGSMSFTGDSANEIAKELQSHPPIALLLSKLESKEISQRDFMIEVQRYLRFVEKHAQYNILGIKRPYKDENGEAVKGRYVELSDLQEYYLSKLQSSL